MPLRWMDSSSTSFNCAASSRTACSYIAACALLSVHHAVTSVLSGRSAMMLLSVLSRRRMYGPVSWRSGAKWRSSSTVSFLDQPAELRRAAQQAGVDEVKEAPQVAQPVFDRGAGQSDAALRAHVIP